MANQIPRGVNTQKSLVGAHILDIISSGMYSNPLMVIREYVQNAADAIDMAIEEELITPEESDLKIQVNGKDRIISIQDNGIGVSRNLIVETLCTMGISSKNGKKQRGFRGIGRLGGIAYCKKMEFSTRYYGEDVISTITWDSSKFTTYANTASPVNNNDILNSIVEIKYNQAPEDAPKHFFCAKLIDIVSFHDDSLMNLNKLKEFLVQVAPLAYDHKKFSFAGEINNFVKEINGFKTYNIMLNDEKLYRPYSDVFYVLKGEEDKISNIQTFELNDIDGNLMGRGWYAQTSFKASIPPSCLVRGIRIRQGNIGIGDEYFLDSAFKDRRFGQWHIGEIHLDLRIKTNARRDGFEHTPESEKFLEWISILGAHLTCICRKESDKRCFIVKLENLLSRIEAFLNNDLIISKEKADKQAKCFLKSLAALDYMVAKYECNIQYGDKISFLKKQLDDYSQQDNIKSIHSLIDGRKLRNISKKDLLLNICNTLSEARGEENSKAIIKQFMAQFLKVK